MTPMTQVITPIMLSTAGLRLAGYMLENNLRVAQEFGRAAVLANPFLMGVRVKYSPPAAKAQVELKAKSPAAAAKPVTEQTASAAAPVASKPSRLAEKAPAECAQVVHLNPSPSPKKAAPDHKKADAPKRPRAPSKPPAMPAPRGVAMTGSDLKQG